MAPIAIPASDLLTAASCREFILLAGKDGVGKTSALISLAEFVAGMWPDATYSIIDTENKVRAALSTWGNVPANIRYYKCEDMNDVTETLAAIMATKKPGDWLAVESMGRIWERAQDLGYQAVTGTAKAAYMEKRRATPSGAKQPPVTPRPDDLWSITKGAHDSAFLDILSQSDDLNVVLSTTIKPAKQERGNRQESPDRKALKVEFGIDIGLDGAPRLPYYVQSLMLLDRENGKVNCRILRDNLGRLDDPAITFEVPTRRDWATQMWIETGR